MPLEQWFFETPVCTRWWTTATVVTGILVQCQILTPFQLFYSWRAVYHKQQVRQQRGQQWESTLLTHTHALVLATDNDLYLLWSALTQPRLPHLLHPAIRPHAGRVRRLRCPFQLAPRIHLRHSPRHRPPLQPGLLRHHVEQHSGLYLVEEKSRYQAELLRPAYIQGAMAAMGAGSLQRSSSRALAQRRAVRNRCWPW